ncbi:MAG: FimB/Mfa2 family fimbrial subunit, partial [Erysipelotrichaceae bacterium]|nr:FimB/Mfa2 family fimbrial subunit [Erysipelotrichaceae bacterium]
MWKRLMIALFMLLSAFSVGYAYYNIRLNAVQTAYLAGGTVSGRINQSPSNLSVNNAGMQKGDRILMGVENPIDGDPMAWILSNFINNYTDYDDNGCSTTWTNICSSTTPKSAWFVQSDRKIAYLSSGLTTSDFTMGKYDAVGYPNYLYATYGQTSLVNEIDNLNTMIKNSVRDDRLLAERDLKFLVDKKTICDAGPSDTASCDTTLYSGFYTNNETGKKVFTIGQGERSDSDKSFSESYYSNAFIYSVRYSLIYVNYSYDAAGNFGIPVSINADLALRPSAYFDLSDVVFSLSKGTTTSIGNVTQGSLTGHTNVYNAGINCKPMKLRMYNSAMTAQLNNAKNVNGNNINQITKDKTINLEVDANAGNDGYGGVYTVSALVFDQKGDFAYYKPLENAKGSGLYEFDLTGIPVGKYKIAVVNEAYDENSTAPADSSAISDVLPLEIVEPVSIKTTAKTGLEYSKNVNQNDTVATYIVSNGADPITVTMASDSSVSGHENDYQLFAVSNGKVIVNDLSGLNAGDYYFKLNAVDSNGDPNGGVNSSTVHIIVAKTNTSIVFDDPNQTKKSVTDASTSWNETANASPSDGVKITYSKVGGDISLIDIDPDSGAITYKGNGSYGKVKIRATADDDPNTGNDNYNSAYVEKEIVVY